MCMQPSPARSTRELAGEARPPAGFATISRSDVSQCGSQWHVESAPRNLDATKSLPAVEPEVNAVAILFTDTPNG